MMGWLLAQAIIEYIHNRIGAKTLFSTHYHELTVLEEELDHLQNVHVSAIEQNGKWYFCIKLKKVQQIRVMEFMLPSSLSYR